MVDVGVVVPVAVCVLVTVVVVVSLVVTDVVVVGLVVWLLVTDEVNVVVVVGVDVEVLRVVQAVDRDSLEGRQLGDMACALLHCKGAREWPVP